MHNLIDSKGRGGPLRVLFIMLGQLCLDLDNPEKMGLVS
jgi:hypothetical protein